MIQQRKYQGKGTRGGGGDDDYDNKKMMKLKVAQRWRHGTHVFKD
jgi:hypothetical protein